MLFYENLSEFIEKQFEKLDHLKSANIPEVGVIQDALGPNDHQDMTTNPGGHSVTKPVDRLSVDCHGVAGDRHRGPTRPSTGREGPLYKKTGVPIVNRRQIFAVSPYECTLLSRHLDVEITPQLLGANLVIGREDGEAFSISDVPLNTYLVIAPPDADAPSTPPVATLIQYIQQKGCSRTGRVVAKAYDDASLTKNFVAHSEHQRGILGSVEYPVDAPVYLQRGQKVFFKFPIGSCY
jgi:hypothetical protein